MNSTLIELWQKYYYVFLEGLWGTVWMSAVSVIFASIIGIAFALLKLSKFKIINAFINAYMSIIRGTPILLQLYFFWLLLPKVLPFKLSDTTCILIALVINASSYITEVVRAGIQSVDIGQTEAAKSLGITPLHIFSRIVMPQALKAILPALGNQYIQMVKQTSLASVFFIPELMTSYKTVQSATFLSIPSLLIAGVIYFLLTAVLTKLIDIMERRLNRNDIQQPSLTKKEVATNYTQAVTAS